MNEYAIPVIEISPIINAIIPVNKLGIWSPNTAQIKNINKIIDMIPNEKAMLDFIDNNETIIIKTQKPSKDIKDTAAIKDLSKDVVLEKDKDKTPDLSVPLDKHQLYQVKKGDNLTKIVKSNFKLSNQSELNSKIKEIANLNGIKAVDIIHTGDIIKLS